MSVVSRCPEADYPDPCSVGICSGFLGDIIATNVVGQGDSTTYCLFSTTPLDDVIERFKHPALVAAMLYVSYRDVLFGKRGYVDAIREYDNIVFKIPLWRKLLSIVKPVRIYGYRWDGRERRWQRCVFLVRWLPRRRVVMRCSS